VIRDVRTSLEKFPLSLDTIKEVLGEAAWPISVRSDQKR
jgi:hypothetical protein